MEMRGMERKEDWVLVNPEIMQIVSKETPDFWFDPTDLTEKSLIVIRRESVTCCGFLGGDKIIVINSGKMCADLLRHFRLTTPKKEMDKADPADSEELQRRALHIISSLHELDNLQSGGPADSMSWWQDLITEMNNTIWFAGAAEPLKVAFDISGDIQTFLKDPVYSKRLIDSLHWWYNYEATHEERRMYVDVLCTDYLQYPIHSDWIIRAINLYNHGSYEVAIM